MRSTSGFMAAAIGMCIALAACGGGQKNQSAVSTTSTASSTAAAGSPMSAQTTAPVPASVHCGAVAPVWANTRTHAYHLSSDPLYGRTKHGQYMCPQTAVSEGYHQAGSSSRGGAMMRPKHHRRSGSMMQAQPSPSPAST